MYRLTIIFIFFFSYNIFSQQYNPLITHFTQKDYGDSCHLQNLSVTQAKNGLMYFGNNYRVLEYDGVNWNLIRTPTNGGFVSSLYYAHDSVIYVGADSEFGYLSINKFGKQKYVSLSDKLDKKYKDFDRIWQILSINDKIIFHSLKKIFIYDKGKFEILSSEKLFHTSFVVNNTLHVRKRGIGLTKYKNGKLNLINNGEKFKNPGIFQIIKINDAYHLIITQELGLFKYYPNKEKNNFVALKTVNNNLFISSEIIGAKLLNDKNIALNTNLNGLIIIDSIGNIKHHFNIKTGLPDNSIRDAYQDNYGNIWLATNLGIVKINYNSPISFYNSKNKLEGRIKDIVKFENKIYIGSSAGLFVHKSKYNKQTTSFKKIGSNTGEINSLLVVDNELLVASNNGLYVKKNQHLELIDKINATAFLYSKKRKLLYLVGNKGFAIYKKNGHWIRKKIFEEYSFTGALNMIETTKTLGTIWVGSLNDGLNSFKINENLEVDIKIIDYNDSVGIVEGWVDVFLLNNKLVISQIDGLSTYIDKLGVFDDINYSNKIKGTITELLETKNKIWLFIDGKIAYFDKKQKKIIKQPFKTINVGKIKSFFDENSKVWIGGGNQLVRFNFLHKKSYNQKPNILIRKVFNSDSSFVRYGNCNKKTEWKLNYNQNSLFFFFASLYEENGYKALYSYKLINIDENWSAWSNKTDVFYKKLPAGKYTFLVKAKDVYGNKSKQASFKFIIHSAWYNSNLAYIFYFILIILILIFIVNLYTSKLQRDKQRLENIVKERTSKIIKQRDALKVQNKEIELIHNEQTNSIEYAKKIQTSVLPDNELFKSCFNEHFIFFQAKDIVSGDFYWISKTNDKLIIALADCTGHGVPGAFMSMLGISFLDEIVEKQKITEADEILNLLRIEIIKALRQKGLEGEQKDGMDMAMLVLNMQHKKLQYAGAFNPIYIINKKMTKRFDHISGIKTEENNELVLTEIKADRMPIAIYGKMDAFNQKNIELKKDDIIYIFSDGFADQFGGEKNTKYKYKPFKQFLLQIAHYPLNKQKQLLEKEFYNWKGNEEQLDDVSVLAIKI